MTSNEILKADVIDILFENRNKQYGAYTLRKHYNNRLSIALGISLSAMLLLFFLLRMDRSSITRFNHKEKETLVINTVEIPKQNEKIIPPPKAKMQVQQFKQRQFTTLVIKDKPSNPPPDVRDLTTDLISNKTVGGIISDGTPIINPPVLPAAGNGNEEQKTTTELKPQKEPEFPGGTEAWLNFLRKNLIPPTELEPGEKKTVAVRFLVDVDGLVTGFQVLQSAGRSFDNEVIRVLKKMPKWKPAIQNGQPVERAFTQPVTFVGSEE